MCHAEETASIRTTSIRRMFCRPAATAAGLGLALLLGAAGASVARAEKAPEDDPRPPLWDESRFTLHAFFTQAYAVSDGRQILGIDEDGTHDYRMAALQLRYRMSEDDSFAVQLAHERLGESLLNDHREDVELDWAFYRRRLSDTTDVKVGKVPIPRGIFNEILDVGTVLPFHRPPLSLYGESSFSSETVDGLVLSHSFLGRSPWSLDVDAYYGGWELIENVGDRVETAQVEDAVGFQAWLRPPLPGLRIGIAGQQFLVSDGILRPPGVKERWRSLTGSAEWRTSRFVTRVEHLITTADAAEYTGTYGQVGIYITPKLTLNLQAERGDLAISAPSRTVDIPLHRDRAVGLAYAFRSSVVLKVEIHRTETYAHAENPPALFPGPPAEADYGIVGLSISF